MEKKSLPVIRLTNEKDRKIYMDPLRQRMLLTMSILSAPVTAKGLGDEMGITPSAAKHHLLQLERIGLVGVDHTQQIHGITAVFYRRIEAEVHLGLAASEGSPEEDALAESILLSRYQGFRRQLAKERPEGAGSPLPGDLLSGVLHLTVPQAEKLYHTVLAFLRENETVDGETEAFPYALVFYRGESSR